MKKYLFLFLTVGVFFTSCENQLDVLSPENTGSELKTKVVVNFKTTKAESSDVFNVSIEELKTYMANQTIMSIPSNSKARTISEETIEPIVSGADTVMYLVNYSDGWCLFSGDKRTEAILAYSETGHLSLKDIGNMEGFSYWFTDIRDGLKKLKKTTDYEVYSEALKKWVGIDSSISQVALLSVDESESDSYVWTLIGSETVSTSVDSINHILQTSWSQSNNDYVPYTTSTSSTRCPAGCVSVAASQVLYYLHYKIGYPQTMPSTGSCVGYAGNYTQTFGNFTSSVFDDMNLSGNTLSEMMIAYVGGKLLNTIYAAGGSSAFTSDIPSVFDDLGITSEYGSPDFETIESSLKSRIPIIVQGQTSSGEGHSWVIDGYKKDIYEYDEIYAFCNDSLYEATGYVPEDAEIMRVRKTGEQNPYYLMNWGWGYIDNTFYYCANPWLGYDYNRKMVYNIRKK